MRILVQRSLASNVEVNEKIVGQIEKGMVLFVGFSREDTEKDVLYLVNKVANLRIFDDEKGVMNKSILEVEGRILSVSQFTLYADTSHGNRPSYKESMHQEEACKLYDLFNLELKKFCKVETGIFRENMKVCITNDGPVTILLESRKK